MVRMMLGEAGTVEDSVFSVPAGGFHHFVGLGTARSVNNLHHFGGGIGAAARTSSRTPGTPSLSTQLRLGHCSTGLASALATLW